ncbi:MAG TPA: hypothetical protein VJ828_11575 [Lacipirellulaceae bacterium]|nr:hypothetical protein [Lacipirellulaceae bacterium]
MRYKLRTLFVILAVAATALFVVDNGSVAVWDGHFPLQVYLRGTQDRRIIEVAAELLPQMEYADYVRNASSQLDLHPERVNWVVGQSFTVRVPCSGRTSTFGRELSYTQFKLLVVQISFMDGQAELIPVEIPDGRKDRDVIVIVAGRKPTD